MMIEKKKEMFGYLAQFWTEERKLTWLLVALIFDTVIFYPLVGLVSNNAAIQIMNSLIISLILILGLLALTRHKIARRVFGAIIITVISVHLLRLVLGVNWLMGWDIFLSLITIIAFVSFILKYVYKEGPVTRQRIRGAVAAYLLIAIAFGLGYHLISFLIPEALKFQDGAPNIGDPRFVYNLSYFSITTITTLGYGDIIPVHPLARTLAMMEALVGQLYPAILLARLVSLHILHSYRSDK